MPDEFRYDLDFRPETYFEPENPDLATLSRICGTSRRRDVEEAVARGDRVLEDSLCSKLDDNERTIASSIHPSLMGGEYLPDFLPGEVEIARIDLDSTTCDAISLRARSGSDRIRYRLVDEYMESECEYRLSQESSRKPLTMKKLIRILDESRYSDGSDESNGGIVGRFRLEYLSYAPTLREIEELRDFASVSSVYYPDLERWYQEASEEWYLEKRATYGFEPKLRPKPEPPAGREAGASSTRKRIRRVSAAERVVEIAAEMEQVVEGLLSEVAAVSSATDVEKARGPPR